MFSTTYEKVHDPVFAPVAVEVDVDARTARIAVPGMVDTRGEPILNPVTGDPHRARIELPMGFEYALAEVGRGWTKTSGPIEHDLKDSHAHFAPLRMNQSGVIR